MTKAKKIAKKNNVIFYVVISLLACLAIGSGVAAYAISNNVNVSGDYNYYEAEGQPVADDVEGFIGAMSGPDNTGDYESLNGVTTHLIRRQFTNATNTAVSFNVNFGRRVALTDMAIRQTTLATSTVTNMGVTTSTVQFDNSAIAAVLADDANTANLMGQFTDISGHTGLYATSTPLYLRRFPGTALVTTPEAPVLFVGDGTEYIHLYASSTNEGAINSADSIFAGELLMWFEDIK